MAEQRKELKLAIKYEADTRAAQDANKKLAESMSGVSKAAADAQAKMKQMAGTTPGGGMGAPVFDRGPVSKVAAFDRPIPVIVVGPRPLPVAGFGGPGAAANQNPREAAAASGPGLLAGLGQVAGYTAAVAGVVGTVANLTKAIQGLDNPAVSARDKLTSLASSIPVLGSALGSLAGSVTDAIERLRDPELARRVDRMRADQGFAIGESRLRFATEMKIGDVRKEARDAAIAARGFDMVGGQTEFDKGLSALGGVTPVVGADPRLRASQEEFRRAQREFEVGKAQLAAQEEDVRRAKEVADRTRREAEEAGVRARAAEARAGLGPNAAQMPQGDTGRAAQQAIRNNPGLLGVADRLMGGRISNQFGTMAEQATQQNPAQAALIEEQRKIQDALQAQTALEKESLALKQRMIQTEQQRYEMSKRETDMMKSKLAILQDEEARVRAGTQQFGEMDVVTQQALLDALERFKKGGREAVTEGEYQAIRNNELSRGLVQDRIEQDQSNNPAYQRLLAMTGNRDLKAIEQERQKVETEIRVKMELDEVQFKKLLADGLKASSAEQEAFFKNMLLLEVRQLRNEINTGRLNRSP